MQDEWDFQRIRRFMDEQAAMPDSSAFYTKAADFIRQLPAAPCGICSTMASEVLATNSRLKAPAATVKLQPVQQSPSITSYMTCQPSMNRSFEVSAADQSKLIFQQTVPTFTELVVQASSRVEEIRHDLQEDVAIIPANHAPKRYKISSSAEKLFNQQTVATSLREADQAHDIQSERSGKAVYRKHLQQLQTDPEEPNLELRLGNGHLHNVDVQGRTFLYSKAKELQRQRAAAAACPISCHIPVEVSLPSPNEFRYCVQSRGGVLRQVASAFSRPPAAAPPPIIGSTSTAMQPVSSRAAVQQHPRLAEPNHSTVQLEALKEDARAAAVRSYRQQFIMTRSASSSEVPIVLPPVPYATTESYKGPPHQNCSPATTTISNATIMGHPAYSAIMGTMAPRPRPPPLMMMRSMGPPPLPGILGTKAAQVQRSVISNPFPPGRPLQYSPGDVSLCKYYVHFLLLELLQLFMSHQIRKGAPPPELRQQQEVANRAALVQIPCLWTNAPAVATAAVVLPEVISKHLPKEAVPLILRIKVAVNAHNYSASSSSSSSQPEVGAVAQHHELLDWPVTWRPTAGTSSICDGWSQFVKDVKLEVGDFCRFCQNALDRSVFEVEITTRPIKL
ncbi:unnamed protein product [Sphagnum troendelagicum]|uniref:TF-B3 domain-containing protein n=1 Tax=Sphagnum troendelagicum TaxID=128251 RepID=A0ABP0UN87_9BRYO